MSVASKCRSCGASIIWCETVNGKRMPVDEDPDPNGKIVLDETVDPPKAAAFTEAADSGADRFTSHFATCVDSKKWRKS